MLKDYNKLWVFGDSFTTPNYCVKPQDAFWGLTATHCNIPTIINCSQLGTSFDSISHMLVSMQNQYDWDKNLFLIGIPVLERITVFDDFKNTEYHGCKIDSKNWEFENFQIESHRGLVKLQNYGDDKNLIAYSDRSWTETQALRTIFLLTAWLDSVHANYMIINLTKDFDKNNIWGPSEFILPYAINHPRCMLFENTYYSINLDINEPVDFEEYGWYGHHGSIGNKYFFERSLLPTMQRNGLC